MFNHGLGDLPDDIWRYIHAPCFKWYLGIFLKRLILQKQVIITVSPWHILRSHTSLQHTHTLPLVSPRGQTGRIWQNLAESGQLRLLWMLYPQYTHPSNPWTGHGDSRPVGGSAMCHALHASAGEEDWHRACVTLAQFDVLCPRTGTAVGGIAMCHNHNHPELCRLSLHTYVRLCACCCFCIAVMAHCRPLWMCTVAHSVWVQLLYSGTDSFFLTLCFVAIWRPGFTSCLSLN